MDKKHFVNIFYFPLKKYTCSINTGSGVYRVSFKKMETMVIYDMMKYGATEEYSPGDSNIETSV